MTTTKRRTSAPHDDNPLARVVSVRKAAARLGVSRETVYHRIKTGQLAHIRVPPGGTMIRIPKSALVATP